MTERDTKIVEARRQISNGQAEIDKLSDQIARRSECGQDSSEARAMLILLNDAQQLCIEQLEHLEN